MTSTPREVLNTNPAQRSFPLQGGSKVSECWLWAGLTVFRLTQQVVEGFRRLSCLLSHRELTTASHFLRRRQEAEPDS